jgi:14-3-3 protein epsilon
MSLERCCLFHWLRIGQSLADSNPSSVQDVSDHADHIACVKRAVQLNPVLTPEERVLLARTYEDAADSRADSLRLVSSLIDSGGSRSHLPRLRAFRAKLEEEFSGICLELIHLVDALPGHDFFRAKLKADFYRRLCVSIGLSRHLWSARDSYKEAMEIAKAEFGEESPDYLALVVDFCTFLRHVAAMPEEAVAVGAAAYEAAVGAVDDPKAIELLGTLREVSLLCDDGLI